MLGHPSSASATLLCTNDHPFFMPFVSNFKGEIEEPYLHAQVFMLL